MRSFRTASVLAPFALAACAAVVEPPAPPTPPAGVAPAAAPATATVAVVEPPPAPAPAVRPPAPPPAPAAAAASANRRLDDLGRSVEPQGGATVYRPLRRQGALVGLVVGGYLHLSVDGRRQLLAVEYPSGIYRGRDAQATLKPGARLKPAYDPLKRCLAQRNAAHLVVSSAGNVLARETVEMSTECATPATAAPAPASARG